MRVTEIFCEVQWSEAVKNGDGWKKVALARKAVLESGDNYQECHQRLYDELAEDLKAKFKSPNPPAKPDYPQPPIPKGTKTGKEHKKKNGTPSPGDTRDGCQHRDGNSKPKTKMCAIHGVPMSLFTNKNGGSWYSHNDETTSGDWCSGKPKKKGNKK